MATLAVRLRRGVTLARAFSTATFCRAQPSSRLVPVGFSVESHLTGFSLPLPLSQCLIGHRRVSTYGPVCSPVDSDNKRGDTTILFEGCDYEHWLITMEFPDPQPTREEKIDTFIKTLAKVVGSEEEAKKKIYALSTTTYTGFQAQISEELSEKMKGLPGVVWVLPDSYIDPINKEYGGDKYINGVIIPDTRVYNNRSSGRYNDRPRNRMRRDSMPVERRDPMPMDGRGGMQGDRRDFRPPLEGRGPMAGGQQDYNRPPPQGPFPSDRQDYNRLPPPLPMEGRGPMPGGPQDYNRPPQNYNTSPPQDYNRPPQDYNRPPQNYNTSPPQDYNRPPQDYNRPPPQDYTRVPPPPPTEGRGAMPGYQQDYNRPPPSHMDGRGDGRGPMPGYQQDYYNRPPPPPPMEGRGPMPGDYNRPPPSPPMEGRGPMPGDYNRPPPPPPMEGRGYQQDYYRPTPPPSMQGERQDYRPPIDGRGGPIPGDRQEYRSNMDGRGPMQGGRSDYIPQGGSTPTQGRDSVQGEQKEAFPWPMEGAQ